MSAQINAYLSFRDNARDAMTFYNGVFGGELTISTFGEFQASDDPAEQDKVMHARLEAPNGIVLMAADTPNSMERPDRSNISMSLSGEDETELRGYWDQLSEGGQVAMPLEPAPWGDTFGMCVDRFGTAWMVNITGTQPAG